MFNSCLQKESDFSINIRNSIKIDKSYLTDENRNILITVQLLEEGMMKFFKHWLNCIKKPFFIFHDLRGFFKINSLWFAAWGKLKKMKNFSYAGLESSNLKIDNLSRIYILHIKNKLLKGHYNWKGVMCFSNQLIEEVLRLILEPIYEGSFEDNLFGFRPNRNKQDALKYLYLKMKGIRWGLQGSIKGFLKKINKKKLLDIISVRVKCSFVTNLIFHILKNNCLDISCFFGNILVSLFLNIYFDFFDKWIKSNFIEIIGSRAYLLKKNLTFQSVTSLFFLPYSRYGFSFVKYIRYGNFFFLGVSKRFILKIKSNIINFFCTELFLDKKDITFKVYDIYHGFSFLGFLLKKKKNLSIFKSISWCRKYVLYINLFLVLKYFIKNGFCNDKGIPLPIFTYMYLSQYDNNLKANLIINTFCNKWFLAFNKKKAISFVVFIIKGSLAKMYAAKFRLRTIARVYLKGGVDLGLRLINKDIKSSLGGVTDKKCKKIQKILYVKSHLILKSENLFFSSNLKPPAYILSLEKKNL